MVLVDYVGIFLHFRILLTLGVVCILKTVKAIQKYLHSSHNIFSKKFNREKSIRIRRKIEKANAVYHESTYLR